MLFSWAVRAIYIESSVMFVRGGVYRVVKEAMGGTHGEAVGVGAALRLRPDRPDQRRVGRPVHRRACSPTSLAHFGIGLPIPRDQFAAVLAMGIIVYFWWRNTRGLHESSSDALHIMQITTVMVVILLVWSVFTLLVGGGALPPTPTLDHLSFSEHAVGWLKDTRFPAITAIALLIGFGHSFLAMSGYESLAQVYREIESPKPLNLRRTGLVVFVYSLVFTASVSFLAAALIPDSVRPQFYDNLISGIAMNLAGPQMLRLALPGVRRRGRLPDPRRAPSTRRLSDRMPC